MTEPVYTYIKGQGWVPQPPYFIETVRLGKYMLTVEDRQPNVGEYYWRGDAKINLSFVQNDRWWLQQFNGKHETLLIRFDPYINQALGDQNTVVSFERIEP